MIFGQQPVNRVKGQIPPQPWRRWLSRAWDLLSRSPLFALSVVVPGLLWSLAAMVISAQVPADWGVFRSGTFMILTGAGAMHSAMIGRNVAGVADGGEFKLQSYWKFSLRRDVGAMTTFFLAVLLIAAIGPSTFLPRIPLIDVEDAWTTMSDANLSVRWKVAASTLFSIAQSATVALTPSALLFFAIQSWVLAGRCVKHRLIGDALVWIGLGATSLSFVIEVVWSVLDASVRPLLSTAVIVLCIAFPFVCFVIRQELDNGVFENLPKGFRVGRGSLIQATRAGDRDVD